MNTSSSSSDIIFPKSNRIFYHAQKNKAQSFAKTKTDEEGRTSPAVAVSRHQKIQLYAIYSGKSGGYREVMVELIEKIDSILETQKGTDFNPRREEKKKQLSLSLPIYHYQKLATYHVENGMPIVEIVSRLIDSLPNYTDF